MGNVIEDIEATLGIEDVIPDSGVPGIFERIAGQLEGWNGRKETDPSMLDTLAEYWDSVGWSGWAGDTSIPWSAAFVSWIQGGDFPGASSHRKYVQSIVDGEAPDWIAVSIPKNEDRIRLNPGDVLVKPRPGGWGNSHGAVVWKVEGGKADLVGGNVSNTAKIEASINVDQEGRLLNGAAPYLVVLKKKRSGVSKTAIGLGILIAVWVYAYRLRRA